MPTKPVVIVGGGPCGVAAAIAAARHAPVVLLDEHPELPGGDEQAIALGEAGIDVRVDTSVWALLPGPVIAAFDVRRSWEIDASAVVIATGVVDVAWPVPGWHLDGVITPRNLRAGGVAGSPDSPKRIGVIGSGENDQDIAGHIERLGATVVIETDDIAGAKIEGIGRVERLRVGRQSEDVDLVVLALGSRPDPTLALQARARSAFVRGHLVEMPLLADDGATSLRGVFVAGGAAGKISDEDAACHGERAGLAAAQVARGGTQLVPEQAPALPDLGLPAPDDPDTIICRDQMVDLATVQAVIQRGAWDVNDVRRQTRAGMGPTQGRDTLPVLAALLLQAHPGIDDARLIARVRPPARPLPFQMALNHEAAD